MIVIEERPPIKKDYCKLKSIEGITKTEYKKDKKDYLKVTAIIFFQSLYKGMPVKNVHEEVVIYDGVEVPDPTWFALLYDLLSEKRVEVKQREAGWPSVL